MHLGDGLVLDVDAYELVSNGHPVELEPQAITVLGYLVEQRHRLVSKEELLDAVWGDHFVSESALTTRIKQIRRALGDDGATQRMIRTVRGRGYQYIGPAEPSPPPTVEPAGLGDLPAERTVMIGRDKELVAASSLVFEHRLVTLLGIGGVGKTTLAAAVGRSVRGRFADGAWFVDLVPIGEGDQLARAIADTVGLSITGGDARQQLAVALAGRQALVILDNCEHLLHDVASLVDRLLDAAPSLRILVTSRTPLGLPDEQRLVVEPLPATDEAGVAMLVACAERYGVRLTAEQRSLAVEVCRRLDGVPLAIELAAAQLRHLSLRDLASRLDQRFALLRSARDDRHGNLGVVFEETWATLTPGERDTLGQLAAFPGAFSLRDLVDVLDQPEPVSLTTLGRLTDRSLVTRVPGDESRYRMLEIVRAFATESAEETQRRGRAGRFADWCLQRVGTDVTRHCLDYAGAEWCLDHFDALRAAEIMLTRDRPTDAAVLVAATGLAMHLDIGNRAAEVLTRVPAHLGRITDHGLRARLHITATFCAMAARMPAALRDHSDAAVDEARRGDDPATLGIALVANSWAYIVSDAGRALDLLAQAGTIAASGGEPRVVDLANGFRSWCLAIHRRRDEAIELAEAVVARTGMTSSYESDAAAIALVACLALDDPARAEQLYQERARRPLVRQMWANEVLHATIHAAAGAAPRTAAIITRLHAELTRSGRSAFPDVLVPIAVLALTTGDDRRARRYAAAIRCSPQPTQSLHTTCLYRQLRDRLGRKDTDPADFAIAVVANDAITWLRGLMTTDR
jgi:predicted ATPase